MHKLKETKKPRIGIYTMGLKSYWTQFEGLRERIISYGEFITEKVREMDAEVFFYGLVDSAEEGKKAGEYFNSNNVDLIFAHSGTYVTSASIIPVHQYCKALTVILNLQPTTRINYDKTTTGEWLAHCGACPVPEFANAFNRAGIHFSIINGLLGLDRTPEISLATEVTVDRPEAIRAWMEIKEWVLAASVKSGLSHSRIGFLGNNYSGMLDMYSDYTMIQSQTGVHVEILEMCDLNEMLLLVTEEEILEKEKEIEEFFLITDDVSADPLAKNLQKNNSIGQLRWLWHKKN